MEYIQRELEEELLKNLKGREIIAVVGPRQSGKTTLLNPNLGFFTENRNCWKSTGLIRRVYISTKYLNILEK